MFNSAGRGQSHRVLAVLAPLLAALMIALSRTCDYHHHWQDVLVGSVLGFAIAYFSYFQHFPPLDSAQADLPLVQALPLAADLDASSAKELPYKVV